MNKVSVATKTQFVGVKGVDVIGHLYRRYTVYLDIKGTGYKVLGFDASPDSVIVSSTPGRAVDADFGIVVVTDDFKDDETLTVYCVKPAPAFTGKLAS